MNDSITIQHIVAFATIFSAIVGMFGSLFAILWKVLESKIGKTKQAQSFQCGFEHKGIKEEQNHQWEAIKEMIEILKKQTEDSRLRHETILYRLELLVRDGQEHHRETLEALKRISSEK